MPATTTAPNSEIDKILDTENLRVDFYLETGWQE
jgi:hypothetical protein